MYGLFWLILALLVLWDPVWRLLGVRQMFPWELKRILRERPESVRLVDVRTPPEHAVVRIRGAQSDPGLRLLRTDNDDDRETVIICMTGHRSPMVAWMHAKRTGSRTINLTWGMLGWLLVGGPSVFGKKENK